MESPFDEFMDLIDLSSRKVMIYELRHQFSFQFGDLCDFKRDCVRLKQ